MDTVPNGHPSLQQRLEEPDVAASLNRILDKIDKIEMAVSRLEVIVDQAPGMLSMTADTLDQVYSGLANRGIHVEEHAQVGLQLLARLTDPQNACYLESLLDRVENLAQIVEQAPHMTSIATDTVDGLFASAARHGVDVEERLRLSLTLLERLTAPDTVQVLQKLLDNMHVLESAVDSGPGMVAMAVDTIDGVYEQALSNGVDIEVMARQGLQATARFYELVQSDEVQALMNSGVLAPETLEVLGCAADALANSRDDIEEAGPFTALRALSDPNVQKALGFLLQFTHKFGSNLQNISCKR